MTSWYGTPALSPLTVSVRPSLLTRPKNSVNAHGVLLSVVPLLHSGPVPPSKFSL